MNPQAARHRAGRIAAVLLLALALPAAGQVNNPAYANYFLVGQFGEICTMCEVVVLCDASAEPPDASRIGLACSSPSDCDPAPAAPLPACVEIADNRWENGYCVGACVLPAEAFVPPRLQRSDCPTGTFCIPGRTDLATGEPLSPFGVCLKACADDADCRVAEGYTCRRAFGLELGTFEEGVCAPAHCQSRGCPKSAICGC